MTKWTAWIQKEAVLVIAAACAALNGISAARNTAQPRAPSSGPG